MNIFKKGDLVIAKNSKGLVVLVIENSPSAEEFFNGVVLTNVPWPGSSNIAFLSRGDVYRFDKVHFQLSNQELTLNEYQPGGA